MPCYTINPLTDIRWLDFLYRHPAASLFHTPGWLAALQHTYSYEPIVVTTCPPATQLTNGIVVCQVNRPFIGLRLVSLPFSDHCEPLAFDKADLHTLLEAVEQLRATSAARSAEIRPLRASLKGHPGFAIAASFFAHELSLTRSPDEVFRCFHKDCIQRKIRRAEREKLEYQEGCSALLVNEFYRLLAMTRRRHGLPPQPIAWFQELIACLGKAMKIRVVFNGSKAVASIVTMQFKEVMVYKYGCSDPAYQALGGMPMLLWRAIEEAMSVGLKTFDFGRCDIENQGLTTFKDRWGTSRSVLTYWTTLTASPTAKKFWTGPLIQQAVKHVPNWLLTFSGRLFYKYMG